MTGIGLLSALLFSLGLLCMWFQRVLDRRDDRIRTLESRVVDLEARVKHATSL